MPCGGHVRGLHGYPQMRRLRLLALPASFAVLAAFGIWASTGHLAAFARGRTGGTYTAASPAKQHVKRRCLRAPRQAVSEDAAWDLNVLLQEQFEETSQFD